MEGGAIRHNFERNHPRIIPIKFDFIWFTDYRGKDLNVKVYDVPQTPSDTNAHMAMNLFIFCKMLFSWNCQKWGSKYAVGQSWPLNVAAAFREKNISINRAKNNTVIYVNTFSIMTMTKVWWQYRKYGLFPAILVCRICWYGDVFIKMEVKPNSNGI